jgi:predicted SprT family Zn-dependent metalloprotease
LDNSDRIGKFISKKYLLLSALSIKLMHCDRGFDNLFRLDRPNRNPIVSEDKSDQANKTLIAHEVGHLKQPSSKIRRKASDDNYRATIAALPERLAAIREEQARQAAIQRGKERLAAIQLEKERKAAQKRSRELQ